ncbi:MAG: hypothetical protein ACYDAD_04440 [Acidimicrobiales bacterium]
MRAITARGGPRAPAPVGMKPVSVIVTGSTTDTPLRDWLATKNVDPSGESFTSIG